MTRPEPEFRNELQIDDRLWHNKYGLVVIVPTPDDGGWPDDEVLAYVPRLRRQVGVKVKNLSWSS